MNKKQSPGIFSYRAKKGMILTFAVLLMLAVMTFIASEDDSVQLVPPAEAQTTTQAKANINNVKNDSNGDPAGFTVSMSAPSAMKMTKLTLESSTALATRPADSLKGISIGGTSYPISTMSATAKILTVSIPGGVDVKAGTPIVVRWAKGEKNYPTVAGLSATLSGTVTPATPPAQGNPTNTGKYLRIANQRDHDACSYTNGVLYSKTWWDNSPKTMQQGNVDVVEVNIPNITNLADKINTSNPALRLRIGSGSGWTDLQKDKDYSITVSGSSVFFALRNSQQRAPSQQTSYDVEAYIPLTASASGCKMTLWNHDENIPEWLRPNASPVDVDGPDTPREELNWLPASSKNPARPQRCGLNIALVFDTSDSVFRKPEWPRSAMNAGLGVIDAMQGTGSRLSIYNFASEAGSIPSISAKDKNLNDNDDVEELRAAVNGFDTDKPIRIPGGRGGTNWEAGLEQIPDGKYDVVYFITDGLPTTSNRDYPGEGFDVGELTNQSDLSRAVEQANRIKESGTRIETVTIGIPPFKENILKDDYFNYNDVSKKPDKWPRNDYGYPAHDSGAGLNVHDMVEQGQAIYIWNAPQNGKRYDVTNQPEIWRAAIRNTKTMAADVSGSDAVTTVEDFGSLEKSLRELVLDNCFGSINVTKLIHGPDGKVSPGQNWTFDTSVDGGQESIIDGEDDKDRKAAVTDSTNEDGSFSRRLDQSSGTGQSIKVVEHQQDGYNLHKQGNGDNAVCTTGVYKDGEWTTTQSTAIRNIDDADKPGFGVDVPFRGIVNCTIENSTVPVKIDLTVQKVSFDDKTEPLNGAEFTLYKVNGANREEVKVLKDGSTSVVDLQVGEHYELVETQAPDGYQLLSRPVKFEVIARESGEPEISMEGGADQYPEISIKVDDKKPKHAIMQVADIRKGDLPKTGGRGLGMIALLAAFVAAGAAITARRVSK